MQIILSKGTTDLLHKDIMRINFQSLFTYCSIFVQQLHIQKALSKRMLQLCFAMMNLKKLICCIITNIFYHYNLPTDIFSIIYKQCFCI